MWFGIGPAACISVDYHLRRQYQTLKLDAGMRSGVRDIRRVESPQDAFAKQLVVE